MVTVTNTANIPNEESIFFGKKEEWEPRVKKGLHELIEKTPNKNINDVGVKDWLFFVISMYCQAGTIEKLVLLVKSSPEQLLKINTKMISEDPVFQCLKKEYSKAKEKEFLDNLITVWLYYDYIIIPTIVGRKNVYYFGVEKKDYERIKAGIEGVVRVDKTLDASHVKK